MAENKGNLTENINSTYTSFYVALSFSDDGRRSNMADNNLPSHHGYNRNFFSQSEAVEQVSVLSCRAPDDVHKI